MLSRISSQMKLAGVLLLVAVPVFAASATTEMTQVQKDQSQRMYQTFLAPCCWREAVSVHRSPESMEMRDEIDSFVRAGKSDQAIITAFVSKHGERILREPRGERRTWLYVLPVLAIGCAALLLILFLSRKRTAAPVLAGPHGLIELDEEFD